MAMNNKQRWMGGVVLLGGGALLAVLLLKGQGEHALNVPAQSSQVASQQQAQAENDWEEVELQPLSLDVETERRLLEKQRAQREKAVAEQEARTAEYLALQQKAEADAARRAAEEYANQLAKRQARLDAQMESSDALPPELIDEDLQQKTAEQREEIERLAAQANVRVDEAQQAGLQAEQAALLARERAEKARSEKEALQKAQAEKQEKDRLQAIADRKAEAEARKKEAEIRKKEAELAAKRKAEDDAKRKKEAELAAKRKAEDEAKAKKAEEQLLAKRKAEDETKRKLEAELSAKRKADEARKEDARKEAARIEAAKKEEARKKQDTETAQRKEASSKAVGNDDKELQAARKKLEEERGRAILEGDTKPWMVQVAIASSQANADAMVAKLRAKGYKVKTSQTTKGVRVMVGPEKGRSAADALRNQVAKDGSLNAKSAWVIDWQPPEPN
jgi:cell division septation protein DedD